MKIYNNMKGQIQFPLIISNGPNNTSKIENDQPIVVPGGEYSKEFMPRLGTLEYLARTFTPDQIAFVISGVIEYDVCASSSMTTMPNYICRSEEDVVKKFSKESNTSDEKSTAPSEKAPEGTVLKEKVIEEAEPATSNMATEETTSVDLENAESTEKISKKKSRKKKSDEE